MAGCLVIWRRAGYPHNHGQHHDTMVDTAGTTRELNAILEFGRVVKVGVNCTLSDSAAWQAINHPDMLYMELDEDGQCITSDNSDGVKALCDTNLGDWTPVAGYSGAQGSTSRGFVMHTSEFIGGGMGNHVIGTPGYYVAVLVDGLLPDGNPDGEDTLIGWALLHRPLA